MIVKIMFFYEMMFYGVYRVILIKFYFGEIFIFRKCIICLEYVFLRENIFVYVVFKRKYIGLYIF